MIESKSHKSKNKLLPTKQIFVYISAIIVLLIILLYKFGNNDANNTPSDKTLIYTKHALCRMDCREITAEDVLYIKNNGKVNLNKSNPRATPCPTIAVEGVSKSYKNIRLILAECDEVEKVVTVIDTENEYECSCK